MTPKAEEAITAMLNCFGQTSQDYRLLLLTFGQLLSGISERAIIEAAERFASGDVHDQSDTFAPSAPQFVKEARRRQEYIDMRERPRLSGPPVVYPRNSQGLAPFEVRKQQAWNEHGHKPILHEEVAYERFVALSKAGELPVGAQWVSSLGIVFGPEPEAVSKSA